MKPSDFYVFALVMHQNFILFNLWEQALIITQLQCRKRVCAWEQDRFLGLKISDMCGPKEVHFVSEVCCR